MFPVDVTPVSRTADGVGSAAVSTSDAAASNDPAEPVAPPPGGNGTPVANEGVDDPIPTTPKNSGEGKFEEEALVDDSSTVSDTSQDTKEIADKDKKRKPESTTSTTRSTRQRTGK